MSNIVVKRVSVALACVGVFAAFGDDAVGVGKMDAATNDVADVEFSFAALGEGRPADFLSGNFMGDGGPFSDRLYVRRAASGETTNAVFSSGEWLDPATQSNTTMTVSLGDTLFISRTDCDPLTFFTFGRVPDVARHGGFPRFLSVSVAHDGSSADLSIQTGGRPTDLFYADCEVDSRPDNWIHLASDTGIADVFSISDALPSSLATRLYLVTDAERDTDGDGIPDSWEQAHGLDHADPLDAALDPDGDGLSNLAEYRKGGDPFFAEPDPTLRISGLRAEFWRTDGFQNDIPDFSALMPSHVSVTPQVNHPAVPWIDDGTSPGDYFACRETGFVRIPDDGEYTFYLTSDDGAELLIAGASVVSDVYSHAARTVSASVRLTEGWHPIEITYYEDAGAEKLVLEWSGPGFSRALVPASAFCHIPVDTAPAGFIHGVAVDFYSSSGTITSASNIESLPFVTSCVWKTINQQNAATAFPGAPSDLVDRFGVLVDGWVWVAKSGVYEMSLASDDGSRLYVDGRLVIDHDGLHSLWTKSATLRLAEGMHRIEIRYFENDGNASLTLLWRLAGFQSEPVPARFFYRESGVPLDTDGDGMPDWWEQMYALDPADPSDATLDLDGDGLSNLAECQAWSNPRRADTDGDGMPDAWEIANGLYPFVAEFALDDPDSDGLANIEEFRLGTDPNNPDTDGDGCPDGMEARNVRSDPLVADIWRTPSDLGSATPAATAVTSTGTWRADANGSLSAAERSGSLTWNLEVPQGGADALAVRIGQHNIYSKATTFDVSLYVDGLFVTRQVVSAPYGTTNDAFFFLPEIPAGSHEFRLVWRNWEVNTFLAVYDLRFVAFDGPDADGDGVADWKEHRASESTELAELPLESLVSPLCVEGRDLWRDVLEIDVAYPETNAAFAVVKTIGEGFYADIPLSTNGAATVSLRDRSLAESFNVTWKPLDVFAGEYATNALVIRTGDALRIAPLEGTVSEVTVSAADGTNGWATVTNWTESTAVPHAFEEPGLHLVEVTHHGMFGDDTAYALVDVVRSRFPKRNPAILMDAEQSLPCPGLSPRNVLEHDSELHVSASVADGGVDLTMLTHADRDLGLVSRLDEGGAISDAVQVSPVWADNGSYYRVAETYPDGSQLVEVSLLLGSFPEGTTINLEIFVSGVTFEDGTRNKTLTADDFDADGHVTLRFVKARGVTTSVCHRTYIYQDGKLIYTNR